MHCRVFFSIVVLLLAVGCGQPQRAAPPASPSRPTSGPASSTAGGASPSAASIPTIPTGVGATSFVLVDRTNAGDSSHYKLAMVGIDGRLIKVLTPEEPSINQSEPNLGSPPLVSISNNRVYYLDGDSTIGFIARDGSKGLATTLPGGPQKLVSFAVSPDDARIAVAIFDYASGGPSVSIIVQDLVGGGKQVGLYTSASNAEWPVGWVQGKLVLAVGPSQEGQPSGFDPFPAPNPYNATGGYQLVDAASGQVLDTIPSQCAFGLLVARGTPCARSGGGVGVRDWGGNTTWYTKSTQANFSTREALSVDGTVAANSTANSVGLFHNGSKADSIPGVTGSAVAMGWVDASHLVVRHFNGPPTVTIVDTKAGTSIDVGLTCGPSTASVPCTDAVMLGTF